MQRRIKRLLMFSVVPMFVATNVSAQTYLISVDEFGHGNIKTNGVFMASLSSTLATDPTGGLLNWNVLIYTLPFAGVQGDVLMQDPEQPGSPILDVIRFDGNSNMIFYSDSIDGFHAPADTPGPPDPFFANHVFIVEQGNAQFGYGDYTPLASQPGWNPLMTTSYRFVSDGVIPEPSAAALLLYGLSVFGIARARGRQRIQQQLAARWLPRRELRFSQEGGR